MSEAPPSAYNVSNDVPNAGATDIYDSTESNGGSGKAGAAKEQAAAVGQGAAQAGQQVASTAKDEAHHVAAETSSQAKDLLHQARSEVTDQAGAQQQRLASGLRALGDELESMTRHSEQQGPASSLAKEAASRSRDVASWLEAREPGHVLRDVQDFARRRPGMFLLLAAGAGVVAGRLGRGIKDAGSDDTTPIRSQAEAARGNGGPTHPRSESVPQTYGTGDLGQDRGVGDLPQDRGVGDLPQDRAVGESAFGVGDLAQDRAVGENTTRVEDNAWGTETEQQLPRYGSERLGTESGRTDGDLS
jgi:hypothetical protein